MSGKFEILQIGKKAENLKDIAKNWSRVRFVFGGATGHASDVLTAGLIAAGGDMWTSVFSSTIIVSSADKILSSFLALAIIGALPTNLQVTGPIMKAENMGKAVLITAGTVVGVILTVVSMNL